MAVHPNNGWHRGWLRGPLISRIGNTNAWAGRTTLASGSTTVTVSTTRVNSDSVVLFSTQAGSVGAQVSSGLGVVVSSIVSGVSFAFARASATAQAWDDTIMWTIIRTS